MAQAKKTTTKKPASTTRAKATTTTRKTAAAKTTRKPAVKSAPVKKTVAKKPVARKTTAPRKKATTKATKTTKMRSFHVSQDNPPFTSFHVTRQTLYWVILVSFIVFAQLWIISLQVEVAALLEAQQVQLLDMQ